MSVSGIEFIKPPHPVSPYAIAVYKLCKRAWLHTVATGELPQCITDNQRCEKDVVTSQIFTKGASGGFTEYWQNAYMVVNDYGADREIHTPQDVWLAGEVPFLATTGQAKKADRLILLDSDKTPKAALHSRLMASCVLAYGCEQNDTPRVKSALQGIVLSCAGVVLHNIFIQDRGGPMWDVIWDVAKITNEMAFTLDQSKPEGVPGVLCEGCSAECEFAK